MHICAYTCDVPWANYSIYVKSKLVKFIRSRPILTTKGFERLKIVAETLDVEMQSWNALLKRLFRQTRSVRELVLRPAVDAHNLGPQPKGLYSLAERVEAHVRILDALSDKMVTEMDSSCNTRKELQLVLFLPRARSSEPEMLETKADSDSLEDLVRSVEEHTRCLHAHMHVWDVVMNTLDNDRKKLQLEVAMLQTKAKSECLDVNSLDVIERVQGMVAGKCWENQYEFLRQLGHMVKDLLKEWNVERQDLEAKMRSVRIRESAPYTSHCIIS